VGGERQSCCVSQKFPDKGEVWDAALSWCNSQFFCRQSSGRSLRTCSRSRCKTSQEYVELVVWPIFVNNAFDVKENDEHALDFALHLSRFSRSRWVRAFCVRLMFSSLNACLIIARVSRTLHKMWCCSFVVSIAKSHYTTPTKRAYEIIHVHPSSSNSVHWLPRYASTIIYSCIALLQLLYRWQHQSRKLWIPT
jgi:hypothetical protein